MGPVAGPLPTASWGLVLVSAVPLPLLRSPDSVPLQKGPPHTDPLAWLDPRGPRALARAQMCQGPRWPAPWRGGRPSAPRRVGSGSRKGRRRAARPRREQRAAGNSAHCGVRSQLQGWRCWWQWQCGTPGAATGPTGTQGHTWAGGSAAGGRKSPGPGGRLLRITARSRAVF